MALTPQNQQSSTKPAREIALVMPTPEPEPETPEDMRNFVTRTKGNDASVNKAEDGKLATSTTYAGVLDKNYLSQTISIDIDSKNNYNILAKGHYSDGSPNPNQDLDIFVNPEDGIIKLNGQAEVHDMHAEATMLGDVIRQYLEPEEDETKGILTPAEATTIGDLALALRTMALAVTEDKTLKEKSAPKR